MSLLAVLWLVDSSLFQLWCLIGSWSPSPSLTVNQIDAPPPRWFLALSRVIISRCVRWGGNKRFLDHAYLTCSDISLWKIWTTFQKPKSLKRPKTSTLKLCCDVVTAALNFPQRRKHERQQNNLNREQRLAADWDRLPDFCSTCPKALNLIADREPEHL